MPWLRKAAEQGTKCANFCYNTLFFIVEVAKQAKHAVFSFYILSSHFSLSYMLIFTRFVKSVNIWAPLFELLNTPFF